ncbi:unnamed protein product [marine sediment metagenome]|uniref:Uncharacterized protein n=1 Tax=marine sediment metagenome TaxID=412755 RepID=X1P8M6_9ZZZZ
MKRKVLISFFVIILILTLSGCWHPYPGYDPYWVPEDDIIELVNYYWYSISVGCYDLAKIYCIPDGDTYNVIEEYEDLNYSNLEFIVNYNWIKIIEDEAIVSIDLIIIKSNESEVVCDYIMYLTKSSSITVNWILK